MMWNHVSWAGPARREAVKQCYHMTLPGYLPFPLVLFARVSVAWEEGLMSWRALLVRSCFTVSGQGAHRGQGYLLWTFTLVPPLGPGIGSPHCVKFQELIL